MARRLLAAVTAGAVLLVACGRSDDTTAATSAAVTSAAVTTAPAGSGTATTAATTGGSAEAPATTAADRCAGVTLEATDIGVSADTITVVVMADVGSELAPGLFQGSMDGVKAWARTVNANGGLACRTVQVDTWDSKINPTEATNGFLHACSSALAMVGSNSLFVGDTSIVETCPDKQGNPTGFPDVAALAVDFVHQCRPNVFPMSGVGASCPYADGPREYKVQLGPYRRLEGIAGGPLHGIYLMANDLPATIISAMPTLRAMNAAGFVSDGEFGVSGRAEQAAYGEFVATMKTKRSNIAYDGSNDQAMIKLRSEALAQGLTDPSLIYACSLACYTQDFIDDPNVEGTYLWLSFLPYEERDVNPEMDAFLTAIGQPFPQSWAAGAWNAGRVFEQAVDRVVARDGPNGLTRAAVLAALPTITDYDGGGWTATLDLSTKAISPCYVMVRVVGGKYQRIYPTQRGTFDCSPGNLATWTGDASKEYKG